MTRTVRTIHESTEPDALDSVLASESARSAEAVADALDSLSEFTSEGTTFKVFKLPNFQWCKDLDPPLDSSSLLDELREEFGSGNYCVRVYMTGHKGTKAQRNFSIAAYRKAATPATPAPPAGDSFTEKLLLALVTGGGLGSDKGGGLDMAAILAAQQASADRQMQVLATMMDNSQKTMATMVGALTGNREGPAAMLTALGPFMPKAESGGRMGELVETVKLVRGLLPAPIGGGEEDSIAGLAFKALQPALPDLARGFADFAATRRADAAGVVAPVRKPADYTRQEAPAATLTAAGRFPLLAEIRDDVLLYFRRRLDPEVAAEAIFDVLTSDALKARGISEADIVPIIATLQGAGELWLDELAREGIDLRSDPAWALAFLNAVIAIYRGDDGPPERAAGGDGDAGGNGRASLVGVAANAGEKPGAGDHERATA